MAYDIASAFEDIELSLIKSMRNNMRHHINEEYDEGINWTQWQAEMLSGLSQYRAQNKDVLTGYMGRLNDEIDKAIREAYATGESEQEIELLKAIKKGYEAPKDGTNMQGRFFRNNQRKLNSLIKATTKDMKKAETALLRMSDDVYRQTLHKAQLFYNTGAGSMWKCIDMATRDFLNAGYNCVQYKNGARVNIASYAEMALRTANKRANLMGQADFRERYGVHTVKVNARGTACPRCLPFLGQVFIDDVYGGGTYEESTQTGYPLLSSAVNSGLFHPNCKDACSSYYEGISREPKTISKEQEEETLRRYNLEQEQRYYERNYRRNMRLAKGCMDSDTADKYYGKANICKNKLIELCDNNSDVLRLDKARISLRGVLSVDNAGRISIKPASVDYKKLGIDNEKIINTNNQFMERLNDTDKYANAINSAKFKKGNANYYDKDENIISLNADDLGDASVCHEVTHYIDYNQNYTITDDWGHYKREYNDNGDVISEEWVSKIVTIKENAGFSEFIAWEWDKETGGKDSLSTLDMRNLVSKLGTSDTYGAGRIEAMNDMKAINKYLADKGISKSDVDFVHLSDFISAMTYDANLGSLTTGGHDYNYWVRAQENRITEITAGYNVLKSLGREDLIEIERDLAPNLMDMIEKEWNKVWNKF